MVTNPSTPSEYSVKAESQINKKQRIRQDVQDLAYLLYDIFKDEEAHGNVTDELDNEEDKNA